MNERVALLLMLAEEGCNVAELAEWFRLREREVVHLLWRYG